MPCPDAAFTMAAKGSYFIDVLSISEGATGLNPLLRFDPPLRCSMSPLMLMKNAVLSVVKVARSSSGAQGTEASS